MLASDSGHYEAVRLLLSRGADVDPINNRYTTPLIMAAGKGHDQVVKVLLEHGADVSCYFPSYLAAFNSIGLIYVKYLIALED